MTEVLRLKNDKRLRDKFFVPGAMSHPAKGHIGLWEAIIERYTKPGDWVLDPMAGIGTTLLAALMGRNVICVELEPHFVEPMKASWAKMQQNGPMLGCELGQVVIVRGDARCLPLGSADHIVTSPPFESSVSTGGDQLKHLAEVYYAPPSRPTEIYKGRADRSKEGYTRPSAIVTSPPWERTNDNWNVEAHNRQVTSERAEWKSGYTRPVDAVVSSPSYEGTNIGRSHSLGEAPFGGPNSQARGKKYAHDNGENIGNQRGQAYWDSMRLCYAECHRVLRPGGIMALVLKGFTRDGKYVDLPTQTAEMVESLGFRQFDHWKRELWSLSFWRILQKRRDPAAFDDRLNYEEVLAFRKDGDGGGIDSVISSPPYEGINDEDRRYGGIKDPTANKSGSIGRMALRYTRPSAIITSPPYEGSFAETDTLERSAENVRQGKDVGLRPDVYTSEGNKAAKGYFQGYTRKGKP